jgi:hypothetical protein
VILRSRPMTAEFKKLTKLAGRRIVELHARELYPGNGAFRSLDPATRMAIISELFKWLGERKHQIVYASVEKKTYYADERKTGLEPATRTRRVSMNAVGRIQIRAA